MTLSVDEFVSSVLMKNIPYCRLCLRTSTERRLLFSSSYRHVLVRFPKVKVSHESLLEQQLCYVCDAMLQRTIAVLDMVTSSQTFEMAIRRPLMDQNRLRSLTQTFRNKFMKSVEFCQKRSKLCITETLNIDSNEKTTIDLTEEAVPAPPEPLPQPPPAFAPTAAAATSGPPGGLILVPSVAPGNVFQLPGINVPSATPGNVFQMPGSSLPSAAPGNVFQLAGNTFHLLNADMQPVNSTQQWQLIQIVNDLPPAAPPPPPPTPTVASPPVTQLVPAPSAPSAGVNVPVTESGTSGSGSQLYRVEDSDCVAYIETNISEEMRLAGAGASEGLCVVPDSYVSLSDDSEPETSPPPPRGPSRPSATPLAELQRIVAKDIETLKAPKAAEPPPLANFTTTQLQLATNGLSDVNLKAARYRSRTRKFEDKPSATTPEQDASLQAQMRESREPAARPAVYGQPIRPVPRDREIDWEDRIPVEVITYADEEPPPPPPRRTQLGVISDVYSQAPPRRRPTPPAPAPHPPPPAPPAPEPRKRLKLT